MNILRDMGTDLAHGRCYLPLKDDRDSEALMKERSRWMESANRQVDAGFEYAGSLSSRRLRAASVLPAMLARETLQMLGNAGAEALRYRVKVPRSHVYLAILRSFAMR